MNQQAAISFDLTFLTNEAGKSLRHRFGALLTDDTRFFDCLVGYFFISGFYKLYPSLEKVEKIRILVGLKTDRTAHGLLQEARAKGYRVHPKVEKAFALGVPQKRQRQLIIGTRLDLPEYFSGELQRAPRAMEI